MREIHINDVIVCIEKLCIDANYFLNTDVLNAIKNAALTEESETGRDILKKLVLNAETARDNRMAICQDTGMAIVFIEIGQDVHIIGGSLTDAVNEGVRRGYSKGFLRTSVVRDPIDRINTGDNTPAIIHYDIVEGSELKITVAPKGFGSENMSAVKMLKPSDGLKGVKDFILETVEKAGPNPCPPIVVGVGVGGSMEKAALMAKKALLRPVDNRNTDKSIEKIEIDILESINKLGIGPSGLGGRTTALAVNIDMFPTHIAGLPVAVNISCHVTRHAEAII